jgi:uncharacterized protein Yka (UPF0111/DUF47 family)
LVIQAQIQTVDSSRAWCDTHFLLENIGQLNQVDDRGSHESVDIASKIETLENRFDDLQTRIINELSTKPGMTAKQLAWRLSWQPL